MSEIIMKYFEIKNIIDNTEKEIRDNYKECIDNNWMSDYVQRANNRRAQAMDEIKELTKD